MTFLACFVAAILTPIAGLHLVWVFGVTWPFSSEAHMVRTVGGPSLNPQMSRPVKAAITLIAAGAILTSALLPLAHVRILPVPFDPRIATWLLAVQTAVFLLRGALGYLDVSAAAPLEPFRTYNRRYYSPLVLALGSVCLLLLLLSPEA